MARPGKCADPVRAAHYDVPGVAIELLGNMNCVSSLREIHAVHAKDAAANGQSSWGLEEFVEHSADFFLAVDSAVQEIGGLSFFLVVRRRHTHLAEHSFVSSLISFFCSFGFTSSL